MEKFESGGAPVLPDLPRAQLPPTNYRIGFLEAFLGWPTTLAPIDACVSSSRNP